MTLWLTLSLTAPILWVLGNVLDAAIKRNFVADDSALMWFWGISRLPAAIIFLMIIPWHPPPTLPLFFMLLGGIIWTVPAIFYYRAFKYEEVSRISLFIQLTPLFTVVVAFFAIGERLTVTQGAGFILLLIGGIIAALKRIEKKWNFSRAFWLIGLACFLWATSDVIFKKFAPDFTNFMAAFAFYLLGTSLPCLWNMLSKKGRGIIKQSFWNLPGKAWTMLLVSQYAGLAASLMFAYALTLGKASLTTVLLAIQPLCVLIVGYILSHFIKEIEREKISKQVLLMKGISLLFIVSGLVYLSK